MCSVHGKSRQGMIMQPLTVDLQ